MKKRQLVILGAAFLATALVCFAAGSFIPNIINQIPYLSGYAKPSMASATAGTGRNGFVPETAAALAYKDQAMSEEIGMDFDSDAGSLTSSGPLQATSQNRKLIRTVDLNVETTEFDALLTSIQKMVSSMGGYMESTDVSGNSMFGDPGRSHAYLRARIPADHLNDFVTHVNEQGNITNQSERVEDVTLQYTDVESHKKSLTIEQERLWELMEKAEDVDAIIALEQRLSEIRYRLESYESQLRTYDNQVDYSTVNISLSEVQVLTPTTPDTFLARIQKGFQRNLNGVCDTFINMIVWLISSIPAFAVLAAFILIIAVVIKRHKKKTTPKKQE